MHRPIRTLVVFVTVTAVAGCGSDPGTFVPPSPAATGGGATTQPTTPPALSREEAAKQYLDIVRPYNEALEQFERAINGGEDLATLTGMAGETADALETEIGQLRATGWPERVRAHVEELVTTSEQALEHWQEAARAQTRDDLVEAALAAGEFDGSDAASSIREILDVDAYDEDDY
ncbi:MAG: hypothetical protein GEV12_01855 [Micromonosporaceae bacterium]|nr:hypothetical protein [Micromonosporaceae bacterium]